MRRKLRHDVRKSTNSQRKISFEDSEIRKILQNFLAIGNFCTQIKTFINDRSSKRIFKLPSIVFHRASRIFLPQMSTNCKKSQSSYEVTSGKPEMIEIRMTNLGLGEMFYRWITHSRCHVFMSLCGWLNNRKTKKKTYETTLWHCARFCGVSGIWKNFECWCSHISFKIDTLDFQGGINDANVFILIWNANLYHPELNSSALAQLNATHLKSA